MVENLGYAGSSEESLYQHTSQEATISVYAVTVKQNGDINAPFMDSKGGISTRPKKHGACVHFLEDGATNELDLVYGRNIKWEAGQGREPVGVEEGKGQGEKSEVHIKFVNGAKAVEATVAGSCDIGPGILKYLDSLERSAEKRLVSSCKSSRRNHHSPNTGKV